MGQQEFWHVTQFESVPDILRDGLLPRLGPRSQDAGETKPGIYLFPSYEAAEDALLNWLGEQFPEDTRLALIKVRLPHDMVGQLESDVDYELVSRQAIPAAYIVEVFDEEGLSPAGNDAAY